MRVDIFERNLESIKGNQRYLYHKYEEKSKELIDVNKLEYIYSAKARDGEQIVIIRTDAAEYRLNSMYRPLEEAKRWAGQYEFINLNTVVAMFGMGNGILIRALLDKMGESDFLIVYEPSPDLFNHVLHNYDITDILSKKNVVFIVEGINDIEFHMVLYSMIDISNIKSQLQCIYPNYEKIFAESCVKFYKEVKNCFQSARININTSIYLGEKYIDNTLKNIGYLKDGISLLELKERIPEGLTAIVVAAGPSVQDNIDELRKAKGKAVIFAVDRILDYLLDSGIVPDFVVSIDPKKELRHFSLREDITIPLICYLESNHEILARHRGVKIICSNSPFIAKLYEKAEKIIPSLKTSGSVAIVTYSACVKLGFKRIVLVGQDLAYSDGHSHAGGVTDNRSNDEHIFLDGLDGEPVRSRNDWREFVVQYQDLIAGRPDVEVIDAKQKGARIKGTVIMPLREVLQNLNTGNIDTATVIPETGLPYMERSVIKEFLEDNVPILKRIKEKARAALKECDKVIRYTDQRSDYSDMDKSYKKLKKINEYIEDQSIYAFLNSFISAKTAQQLAEIGLFTDDMDKNSRNTYQASRAVYQATIDAVEFVQDRLEIAFEELADQ